MTTVRTIADETRKRRLIVFRRDDGSFGFEEEWFSDEPLEMSWIPFGRYSVCRCDTEERALAEARSRVGWLAHLRLGDTLAKSRAWEHPEEPRWLLFADRCRTTLQSRKGSKGGKREESDIHRWYLEACQEYGYKGTERDWFYLLGWRGRR